VELGLERWCGNSAEHLAFGFDSKRQHSYIPAPTGHRRIFHCRVAAPTIVSIAKVQDHLSSTLCILNFGHYREGKRAAEEVADVAEVKKARLEGDEDVLIASTAELPTNKRTHYSRLSRQRS
jgi:hypothetical protein